MSSRPSNSPQSVQWDEKRERIREAYRDLGRPPSQRECAAGQRYSRDVFDCDATWAATLRRAGVPTPREVVVEALKERYENRYPWEETVTLKAGHVTDETGLPAGWVGNVLSGLADVDGDADGLRVERGEACGSRGGWWEVSDR